MSRALSTYEQALQYLYSRVNYERVHGSNYSTSDFKLTRMRRLLELLGNPHERIPAVHIAGTKGKGSTAAMVASMLTAAGNRVGLFTSPHITDFEERMTVGGVRPERRQVVELVNALIEPVAVLDQDAGLMGPTYFELTTAMAWLYFRQQAAQLVVLEVGMGGRLDATNLCQPEVCIITSISRDHTQMLGSELSQIAFEKAGIVKPGIPVVSGVLADEARQTVAEICHQQAAPLIQLERDIHYQYDPQGRHSGAAPSARTHGTLDLQSPGGERRGLPLPMLGAHQAHNTALAVSAVEALRQRGWRITAEHILDGLLSVRWPARIEVVSEQPTVIVDAAHNWASVTALLKTLAENFQARSRVLVFAATKDKDVSGMLRQLLPRFDTVILTCYLSNPRVVPLEHLASLVRSLSPAPFHLAADSPAAWKLARRLAGPEDLICVTGSFFIAAEMRELILAQATDSNRPETAEHCQVL
jgi:dihydrofolate synthase/folylpolyglutamate synthase